MKTVRDICEAHYDAWIYDCSGFLKAVASDLGISLTGQANDIIDHMNRTPWRQFGHDSLAAVQAAALPNLVVAGLKADPNGHVAVIMPGSAKPYPMAYWGSIARHPGRGKLLNWAWVKADLPRVEYFSCSIPSPIAVQ